MPKTYPPEMRQRAVALAQARGIPAAAKHFDVAEATVVRWVDEAPALSDLETAYSLAMSDLTAGLATGETRGRRDLAVVAGIMRDKLARYGRAEPEGPAERTAAEVWADELQVWVEERWPGAYDAALDTLLRVYDAMEDDPSALIDPDFARRYLMERGGPDGWAAADRAEDLAERKRLERIRLEARFGPDVLALLERAEAELRKGAAV